MKSFAFNNFMRKVKDFFTSIGKGIVNAFKNVWLFLRRHKIAVISVILSIVIVVGGLVGVKHYLHFLRKPNVIQGNVFDEPVMELFWLEDLQKPQGVVLEEYECHISNIEKNGRQTKDKRGLYEYVCYTTESLSTDYVQYVKNYILQNVGEKYLTVTPQDSESMKIFGSLPTAGEGLMTFDYERLNGTEFPTEFEVVKYSVYYSNIAKIKRNLINGKHCVLAYCRYVEVESNNVADENGYYKTKIRLVVTQRGETKFYIGSYKDLLKKFKKIF